jgi:tRNA-2-methylthio-N6-dimethylallyladenosine synthase
LELIEYGKFDMIYIGIYSSRPGTLAQKKYADDVSREVKRDRWNRLNEVLKRISTENNEKEVGHKLTMLVNEIRA